LWEIDLIDDAVKVATKILAKFRQPMVVNEHKLMITISIGIALFPEDGTEINDLVKNADKAMYLAKESGRDTFKLHASNHIKNKI
jgi:diguanylate cyclase